jgi:hypothetical protein
VIESEQEPLVSSSSSYATKYGTNVTSQDKRAEVRKDIATTAIIEGKTDSVKDNTIQ